MGIILIAFIEVGRLVSTVGGTMLLAGDPGCVRVETMS